MKCLPLYHAPDEYVWRSNTDRLAHLVPLEARSRAECGKRARGGWLSYQIGGYTAVPCEGCLASPPEMEVALA